MTTLTDPINHARLVASVQEDCWWGLVVRVDLRFDRRRSWWTLCICEESWWQVSIVCGAQAFIGSGRFIEEAVQDAERLMLNFVEAQAAEIKKSATLAVMG